MKLRNALLLGAAVASFSSAAFAQASGESPWMVRARATHLGTDTSSDAVPGVLATDAIDVNSKWIPELDITYFFTKNIAAELVLSVPQKHKVTVNPLGEIGTFKHLPPTLMVQYHFTDLGAIKPYVGAGVNYTKIWGENMTALGQPVTLDGSSIGLALQAGVDYKLNRNWYLNADIKKVQIKSDVMLGGSKISEVKLDPWLVSIGVGYRF